MVCILNRFAARHAIARSWIKLNIQPVNASNITQSRSFMGTPLSVVSFFLLIFSSSENLNQSRIDHSTFAYWFTKGSCKTLQALAKGFGLVLGSAQLQGIPVRKAGSQSLRSTVPPEGPR